jgi:hypothetical protein
VIFQAALRRVESPSIRSWATSAPNRVIFLEMARALIRRKPESDAISALTVLIVGNAVGL